MKAISNNSEKIHRITLLALLAAVVFVLQLVGSTIRFGPFSVTTVLLPIVIGAAFCGTYAAGFLGAVFAVAVFVSGDAGAFFEVNPVGTILTVFAKGIFAGLLTGVCYRLLEKRNRYMAIIAAAVVCPVVNTGVFLIGCNLFFMDTLTLWAQGAGFGADVGRYIVGYFVGLNFLFELAFNVILSPVIMRVMRVKK